MTVTEIQHRLHAILGFVRTSDVPAVRDLQASYLFGAISELNAAICRDLDPDADAEEVDADERGEK
jgi:hypothetical protein